MTEADLWDIVYRPIFRFKKRAVEVLATVSGVPITPKQQVWWRCLLLFLGFLPWKSGKHVATDQHGNAICALSDADFNLQGSLMNLVVTYAREFPMPFDDAYVPNLARALRRHMWRFASVLSFGQVVCQLQTTFVGSAPSVVLAQVAPSRRDLALLLGCHADTFSWMVCGDIDGPSIADEWRGIFELEGQNLTKEDRDILFKQMDDFYRNRLVFESLDDAWQEFCQRAIRILNIPSFCGVERDDWPSTGQTCVEAWLTTVANAVTAASKLVPMGKDYADLRAHLVEIKGGITRARRSLHLAGI